MRFHSRLGLSLATAIILCLLGAGAAKADSSSMILFTLTGPVDASFELSKNPFIAYGNADPGFGFLVKPVDLTINGVASNDMLAFYDVAGGGGFAAFDAFWQPGFSLYGDKLYKGGEWKPTFTPSDGPISLEDEDGVAYSLTMQSVATPEPSVVLLLVAGLLPLGLLAKRLF